VIMMNTFTEMYNEVCLGNFENMTPYLAESSQELIADYSNPDNQSIDSLISLGDRYKLQYFSIYFSSWSNYMKVNGTEADFFKYLTQEEVSFFDPDHYFEPLVHRCRVGTDNNFVAFYYPDENKNVMDWAKFTDENGSFKLDLLYILRLHNKTIKKYFNYKDRVKKELTEEQWLRNIYKGYFTMNHTPEDVEDRISKRSKECLTLSK